MKSSTLRFIALVFTLVMLAGIFSSCAGSGNATADMGSTTQGNTSGNGENGTADTEWAYMLDTSPTTIDVWFPSCWVKDVWADGWTDEKQILKHITEKTGVSLNVDIPVGTEEELLGVMIASGDLPEVMVLESYTSSYIGQMRSGNFIYNWNELIDEYAPKVSGLIDDTNWNFHTDEDGKLWAYAGFAYDDDGLQGMIDCGVPPVHESNVIFCRKDTLEAFLAESKLDDITTLDQYTDYLHFVSSNFPDLDPTSLYIKETRLDGLWTHFKSTFGATMDDEVYIDEDGNAKLYIYDPAYAEFLSWMNGLYTDGVITQNMLTYDQASHDAKFYSAQIASFRSASYVVFNTLETEIKNLYGDDDNYQYAPIGPIQYDANTPWYAPATSTLGDQATVITKNTGQPERIIRFFEYLLTEDGQTTINCGVEGDTWNYDDGGTIVFTDEIKELASTDMNAYWINYSVNCAFSPWCDTWYWEHYLGSLITQPDSREFACNSQRLGSYRNFFNAGLIALKSTIATGTDEDIIRTKCVDICEQYAMKMITASDKASFDTLYAECLDSVEAENIAAIETVYTAAYHGYCDDLGINYDLYDNDTEIFGG